MIVTGKGHWGGDPETHCEELAAKAETAEERAQLATILRVLSAGRLRRLADLAARIEAEDRADLAPAP